MSDSTTHESAAREHIAECCLIAADIDKTILSQTAGERSLFLQRVAPQLLDSAKMGMKLAFVTGNSMSELADRFLKWLLDHLCHTDDLALLPQFHFFCNSGGVYFHFAGDHEAIAGILADHPTGQGSLADRVFGVLTEKDDAGTTFVRPAFVDADYVGRTRIPASKANEIKRVLEECGSDYLARITREMDALAADYDLSQVMEDDELQSPAVDLRPVEYAGQSAPRLATVQLTLRPVLSFRQGITEDAQARLFENDLRTDVIVSVQRKLDSAGLGHYVARPGGRSSIDVTREELDKAYAMEFLIGRLNLQGRGGQGQRFGANAIYFGDEVIVGGGNDYAVTRIPGLLVFAVNPDRALVPFRSHVLVPSAIMEGPEATADVLGELNKIARAALLSRPEAQQQGGSAIDRFKIRLFGDRIHAKMEALKNSDKLTPDEWQVLHAFVTLMHRDDASARQWLAALVDEFDAVMARLSESRRPTQPAIGTSHPDNRSVPG